MKYQFNKKNVICYRVWFADKEKRDPKGNRCKLITLSPIQQSLEVLAKE